MFSTEISQATEKIFILVNQKKIQKNKKTEKRKTKKHRNQNKEFITKLFSWQCLGFCFLVSVISSYCLYVTVSPGVLILATILYLFWLLAFLLSVIIYFPHLQTHQPLYQLFYQLLHP